MLQSMGSPNVGQDFETEQLFFCGLRTQGEQGAARSLSSHQEAPHDHIRALQPSWVASEAPRVPILCFPRPPLAVHQRRASTPATWGGRVSPLRCTAEREPPFSRGGSAEQLMSADGRMHSAF